MNKWQEQEIDEAEEWLKEHDKTFGSSKKGKGLEYPYLSNNQIKLRYRNEWYGIDLEVVNVR